MILARPEIIFKHKDRNIIKKGFLMKKYLEKFDPVGFDSVWWHERGIKDKTKPNIKLVVPPSPAQSVRSTDNHTAKAKHVSKSKYSG